MKNSILFFVALFLLIESGFSQLPKGNRTLAWQIDMAENSNYDSAFSYGHNACMESIHLFFKWTDVESDTANYNTSFINNFLDIIDIYYPAWDVQVELQIAPTNTGVKEVPSEFMNLPFDDPLVINRFKILLDTVFAHIPNVTLAALNIGNESDINFGIDATQYNAYKVFLDSISNYAKALYFNLHGSHLNTGTTFTHHGLTHSSTASLCKSVNNGLDIVTVTYYPLNSDFTMKPTSEVSGDFEALVQEYPDSTQPIYFAECGYASSSLCNSSEILQADFWTEVFHAWDTYQDNIPYITVFKSTDWSAAAVNELGEYYNLQDTIFKEYLRTLGVRTWNGNGTNKDAYERILCELNQREWCDVSCFVTNANDYAMDNMVSVYPNPATNSVVIRFDQKPDQVYTLKLYNALGQCVRRINHLDNSMEIERQDLKSGTYFYQLGTDNEVNQSGVLVFN